jgi:H+/Cl- antiporter ClcA
MGTHSIGTPPDPELPASVVSAPRHASMPPFVRRLVGASRITLALDSRLLLLSCLVGSLAAVLAAVYFFALQALLHGSSLLEHYVPVPLLMAGAGVFVGLSYLLGEPGETDAVVDNIHIRNGRIDTKANLPLVPCSLASVAAGGSAGPEAPMVYLTGSVGTWLHGWLKLPESYVRTLTLTGMGVGFATLFGAPVGAAIFALEIPHKRGMEYFEATVPAILGCLVGYAVFAGITHHGIGPVWHFPPYVFHSWQDILIAATLGVGCSLCAAPYVWGIRATKNVFDRMRLPRPLKGSLGGLVLGLIAWRLPATRFWGEEEIGSVLLAASPAVGMLLLLAVAKMFTVGVTLAAGWRGGIIIPCFFIGACLGKAVALLVPGVDPTLAMLAGMAAVNVAVMKVPLATVLVISAMSGVPAIAPLAAAAFAAFVASGGVEFLHSKRDRMDSLPHGLESAALEATPNGTANN